MYDFSYFGIIFLLPLLNWIGLLLIFYVLPGFVSPVIIYPELIILCVFWWNVPIWYERINARSDERNKEVLRNEIEEK